MASERIAAKDENGTAAVRPNGGVPHPNVATVPERRALTVAPAKGCERNDGSGLYSAAMSNYNWLEFAGEPAALRYPDWVEGAAEWREAADRGDEALAALLDVLVAKRAAIRHGVAGTELHVPRVFVSHRRQDERRALDVAALAQLTGFQVWVDVLDPVFQGMPSTPRAIADYIEIALLNSTHVIALMTPNTRGSLWVPYEYGRVKDSSPHSLRAACWIDHRVTDAPEYLELGVKTTSDAEITAWLRHEIAAWVTRDPAAGAPAPARPGLTADELEAIARPFREGTGKVVRVLPTASFPKRPPPSDLLE
jgi:hypothetical protein